MPRHLSKRRGSKNGELYYSWNGRIFWSDSSLSNGLIPINPQSGFPIKTLLINIVGAFLIGFVVAIGVKKDWSPQWILFLKVGICGGFTTFSSFALETNQLLERGAVWWAMLYVVLSVIEQWQQCIYRST